MSPLVDYICIGQPRPFRGEEQSAFAKQPLIGTVSIRVEGVDGDTQVDRVHHGGPHMAVHLYPRAHHAFWDFPHTLDLERTITEMLFVPSTVRDGEFLLELQLPHFMNDAAPSRPVLYALLP